MRLKATLCNNLSSCFINSKQLDTADKFNDMALMEDPGYAKAHFNKCKILEAKNSYSQAIELAE